MTDKRKYIIIFIGKYTKFHVFLKLVPELNAKQKRILRFNLNLNLIAKIKALIFSNIK